MSQRVQRGRQADGGAVVTVRRDGDVIRLGHGRDLDQLQDAAAVAHVGIENIGGAFGKYINVEKAIEIGLLPDMPWEEFHFLGNTAIMGWYHALINWQSAQRIDQIAKQMTYIELSADNTFFDAFMSALFLPHTDLSLFPTVGKLKAEI